MNVATNQITEVETRPVKSVTPGDEIQYYEERYREALQKVLNDPTSKEALADFIYANKVLFETYDKYRIAKRLLLEYHIDHTLLGSQKLHRV